jgi:all-trans-8'-apo-beta-carotenal 15,15'-oxygenase
MDAARTLSRRALSWNTAMAASPGALDLTVSASQITGEIPGELRGGRVLSNGPGWTKIGGRIAHPFDGHGYVRAFEFAKDGGCRVRARFVETQVYRDEAAAQRLVHRGFATNIDDAPWKNIGFGKPRNVANTTIVRWGDRLLAGWEGGAPHALDAATLETLGEESFGGAINGQATLAHMHYDAAQDRLVLCSLTMGRNTKVTFREVDRSAKVLSSREVTVEGALFAHDFAITPDYYVLGANPLKMKLGELAKMALGTSTLLRSVAIDEQKPGMFYLIPRKGSAPMRVVEAPDRVFVVHFANAFQRGAEVVVDACVFHRFEFGEEFGYTGPHTPFDPALPDVRKPQRLYRARIAEGAQRATWEKLVPHGVDFPRVHPLKDGVESALIFGATRADTRHSDPFDSIVRVDTRDPARAPQVWTAPEDVFVGEPLFAPDAANEDRGHVMALLSDGINERTTLAVFDASAIDQGPVASVPLPLLPIAFHGEWDGPRS